MLLPRPADSPAASPRHGRVVALVEDDTGVRGAIERLLRAAGFEPRSYASAEAALADPTLAHSGCLVVDLDLPAMSGLDLIEHLRRRGLSMPALLITARDEARVRQEARRRGVEQVLAKPFVGGVLTGKVNAMLRGR